MTIFRKMQFTQRSRKSFAEINARWYVAKGAKSQIPEAPPMQRPTQRRAMSAMRLLRSYDSSC